MGRLSGRVALVTGGGRGIGRAIALAYAREGARVGLAARTQSEIDAVAAEIGALGSEAFAVAADIMNRADVKRMVGQVIARFGRLDIIMNNGGGSLGERMLQSAEADDDLFERNLALNLTSAYWATRAALPQMVAQDHGRVLFLGSGYAKRGGGALAYSAAKHGLIGLTRALAYQVPASITVNILCPGWTNTSLLDWNRIGKVQGLAPEAAKAKAAAENIQQRILEPEELGPMAVLLASDEAKGITGQVISVDGGYRV